MFRSIRWFGFNNGNNQLKNGQQTSDTEETATGRGATRIIHSLEQLRKSYYIMEENQVVNELNRTLLVETLRQIAEILIWGDQNDATVFDYFLEKNMLDFFLCIMRQRCGGYVCTQLLQTLNILFENIRHETSLYYLLSNNHVNSIIIHRFDFDDEEVMAYYISFLKTLSFRLNQHTIHFFFNEQTSDFPLYTEAIKFFHHPEKMVRIAVRTITLNVFRVRDRSMIAFIRDCTAAPYFSNLTWFIGNHVADIQISLNTFNHINIESNNQINSRLIHLDDLIAEHLDHLHYINDILRLNIEDLNSVLVDNLLHRLIIPLYLNPLMDYVHVSDCTYGTKMLLSRTTSLFLLTQSLLIFSYRPLLNLLVNFIIRSKWLDIEMNAKICETMASNSLALIGDIVETTEQYGPLSNDTLFGVTLPPNSAMSESIGSFTVEIVTIDDWSQHPFLVLLAALLKSLDTESTTNEIDDRLILYTLSLISSIFHNTAIDSTYYRGIFMPSPSSLSLSENDPEPFYHELTNCLLLIMGRCSISLDSARIVTFELASYLLRQIMANQSIDDTTIKYQLTDHQLALLEQANEDATHRIRKIYKSMESIGLFIELFEQESELILKSKMKSYHMPKCGFTWSHITSHITLEQLFMDPLVLLTSSTIPIDLIQESKFYLRFPKTEYERIRYAIKVFFTLRLIQNQMMVDEEWKPSLRTQLNHLLPSSNEAKQYHIDQFIDLVENNDLDACLVRFFYPINGNVRMNVDHHSTTTTNTNMDTNKRLYRFMVITNEHIVLIEPDIKHYGWGIIRLLARLQDLEFWSPQYAHSKHTNPPIGRTLSRDDCQSFIVYFRRYQMSKEMQPKMVPKSSSIVARFSFDDQIRCHAARQHLTKAQSKIYDRILSVIRQMIELDDEDENKHILNSNSNDIDSIDSQQSQFTNRMQPIHNRSFASMPGGAVCYTKSRSTPTINETENYQLDRSTIQLMAYPSASLTVIKSSCTKNQHESINLDDRKHDNTIQMNEPIQTSQINATICDETVSNFVPIQQKDKNDYQCETFDI